MVRYQSAWFDVSSCSTYIAEISRDRLSSKERYFPTRRWKVRALARSNNSSILHLELTLPQNKILIVSAGIGANPRIHL